MRTFRAQVLRIFRRKYPGIRAVAGKQDSAIIEIEASDTDLTIDLTNIHAAVGDLPADLKQAAIMEFLEALLDTSGRPQAETTDTASWAEVSKLLRPRLVSPDMRLTVPGVLLRSFAPGALVAYVLDHGQRVEYVTCDELASWGVDIQQVNEVAVANLEVLTEAMALELCVPEGGSLFIVIATNDSYDAARLVLPRFRERLMAELGEPIFVGIPNRDVLVAWSPDHAEFAKIVALVAKYASDAPYPITDAIFRVDRQGVRPTTAEVHGKLPSPSPGRSTPSSRRAPRPRRRPG